MPSDHPSADCFRPCAVAMLPVERVPQVYPLVQSVLPGIGLDDWIDYASALVLDNDPEASAGILAAEGPAGCVAGICAYRSHRHLGHGRVLQVEHLIVLGLFDQARIAAALAEELELTARRLGCAAVHCLLPEKGADHAERALRAFGHRVEARVYCKAIAGPAC